MKSEAASSCWLYYRSQEMMLNTFPFLVCKKPTSGSSTNFQKCVENVCNILVWVRRILGWTSKARKKIKALKDSKKDHLKSMFIFVDLPVCSTTLHSELHYIFVRYTLVPEVSESTCFSPNFLDISNIFLRVCIAAAKEPLEQIRKCNLSQQNITWALS